MEKVGFRKEGERIKAQYHDGIMKDRLDYAINKNEFQKEDNRFLSVSGIVIRENKVLLVRQAYGSAKGLLVIPGGYLSMGEMPDTALEREILEETGIVAKSKNLLAILFSKKDWWAIFSAEYISGEPLPDGNENSEALFLEIDEALSRKDLSYTTKEVLKKYNTKNGFSLSEFCPSDMDVSNYQLFTD